MDVTPSASLPPFPAAKPADGATGISGYRVEALDRMMERAVRENARAGETAPVETKKLKVTLDIDEGTNRVVATLIDPDSGEIKHRLPPEELLRSQAQLRELLDRLVDMKV
jgi:uncharacterized FlaG/YvyC family protein